MRPCSSIRRAGASSAWAPPIGRPIRRVPLMAASTTATSQLGSEPRYLGARLIAADLAAVGIDVDCLPIADVPVAGADPVIGDRAYGDTADKVAALARAVADGLLAGGVLPVLKHIPGHGRATADSHGTLPRVDTDLATLVATDFAAFRPLSDLPLGMTAHIVYSAIDPIAPATTSVTLVRDVIRDLLEFRGLLMSDDISMGALSGSIDARSRAAIAAGCDLVLHCNGKLDEMQAVASAGTHVGGRGCSESRGRPAPAQACCAARSGGPAGGMDGAHGCPRGCPEGDIMSPDESKFEADVTIERATDEPALVVDVEGFEGPLDLLLALARQQKVDLAKISILALADQYLTFIEEARKLRLELAADYLVMAAWLAYLKSRLLLPDANAPAGQSAEDMAVALAMRLKRLEAIRAAAERLFGRAQLDRDVFQRGQPEPIAHIKRPEWSATLYDLLTAYAQQRQKTVLGHVRLVKRSVWSLADAREALERLIGQSPDWTRLDEYLISFVVEPSLAPTVFASSFASTLELVREGVMEVHQQAAFSPIYVRKRQPAGSGVADPSGVAAPTGGKE